MTSYPHKLYKFPILGTFIQELNDQVGQFGIQKACLNLSRQKGVKIKVSGLNSETMSILKGKTVVLAANHPSESDPLLILAASPSRADTYVIINYKYTNIAPNIKNHLIPVYINHHHSPQRSFSFLAADLIDIFHPQPTFSETEETTKNRQSIDLAINKLNRGGLVTIYPGRRSRKGKWFPGIYYLLKGIKKPQKAYLVYCYITGTSSLDWLRLAPLANRVLPTIKIYFGSPDKVKSVINGENHARKSVAKLEEKYWNWVNSLSK